MPSYVSQIAASTFARDMSAVRYASAIRRAFVVVICLLIGQVVGEIELGATAALGAFLVGLLDVGNSVRVTARVMASAAVVLTLTTALAAQISQWQVASFMLLVLLAFATGIAYGVNSDASTICFFGAIMAVQYVLQPARPGSIFLVAIAILFGTGLQLAAVVTAIPFTGEMPERRRVASAMRAIAVTAHRFAQFDDDSRSTYTTKTSAVLATAEKYVRNSDLDGDKRDHYRHLLLNVETIRLELNALSAHERLQIEPVDSRSHLIIDRIGVVLDQAATALTIGRRGQIAATEELELMIDQLYRDYEDTELIPAVRALLLEMRDLDVSIRVVCGHERSRRPGRPPVLDSLSNRLWNSFSPKGDPLRSGLRVVLAVLIAEFVARELGLVHASWIAVTAMSVLRPGPGATLPRIVHRAIGTTVGVSVIIAFIYLVGSSIPILIAAIGVLVVLCYAIGKVNYFFYVTTAAPALVLMVSISGLDPLVLAEERWVDVLVGCVVATILAFAFPIWRVKQLPADVAAYATAIANYLGAIGNSIADRKMPTHEELDDIRSAARRSRVARQAVNARLGAAFVEPPHRNINVTKLSTIVARLQHTAEAAVATEVLLIHGQQPGADSSQYVGRACNYLLLTAVAVPTSPSHAEQLQIPPWDPETAQERTDQTAISSALRSAARSARSALRVAESLGRNPSE